MSSSPSVKPKAAFISATFPVLFAATCFFNVNAVSGHMRQSDAYAPKKILSLQKRSHLGRERASESEVPYVVNHPSVCFDPLHIRLLFSLAILRGMKQKAVMRNTCFSILRTTLLIKEWLEQEAVLSIENVLPLFLVKLGPHLFLLTLLFLLRPHA